MAHLPRHTLYFCTADLPRTSEKLNEVLVTMSAEITRTVKDILNDLPDGASIAELEVTWENSKHPVDNPDGTFGAFKITYTTRG